MGYKFLTDKTYNYLVDSNNTYLVVYDEDTEEKEIYDEMIFAIKSHSVKPVFKLYLLNYDESIKEDVSNYLLDGGSVSITFQNGVRKNASIELDNSDRKWNPSPVSGYLWKDTKFRIDIGLQLSKGEVWRQLGVFIPNDPTIAFAPDNKTVSLQLSDKFASLDGTLGGKIANSITIALDSNIKDAISTLLKEERMYNYPYDVKPIHFPTTYNNEKTAYTITKTDETTVGEIITELAEMLSCDIYYDDFGFLTVEEGDYTLDVSDEEVIWDFDENDMEFLENSISVDFSKLYNVVTVIGANINGDLITYTAQNENPKSQSNIWTVEPNTLRVQDDNIYSVDLAKQRAEYELFKQGLLSISYNFQCTFMPHLNVNKIVNVSNSSYSFKHVPFLIQSINIPISHTDSDISLTMVNIDEVVLK